RGTLIFEADTQADVVFLIREGYVRVFRLDEAGHEATTALLGPGHFAGVAPLVKQPRHLAFCQALTRVSLRVLPASWLVEHLSTDADLLDSVLDAVGRRLLLEEELLREMTLPVTERIPRVLALLQTFLGGTLPALTHEQLGSLVGAQRETVTR